MTKTLVVSYLPRGERSNTKKIVDAFIEASVEAQHLELSEDVPDFWLKDNLAAYFKRDYAGEELNDEEKKSLEKIDRMTSQFVEADKIVVAFPMYNFSMPAAVKAYFDSIMQKGKTWDMDGNGFVGLMKEKDALIIMTSGAVYEGEWEKFEHAVSLTQAEFEFMGFKEINVVKAQGINMMPEKADEIVEKAKQEATQVAKKWI